MVKSLVNYFALILIIIGSVVATIFFTYDYLSPRLDQEKIVINNTIYAQDNMPLLLFYTSSWGEVEDTTETYFNGWLYNYGFVEAKNVTLSCIITLGKTDVKIIEYNAGNIGSTSYKMIDFSEDYVAPTGSVGSCRVKDSDNYISLDNRLPRE